MLNVEDVFVDNGYARREVKMAMEERKIKTSTEKGQEKGENVIRGIVSIPNRTLQEHSTVSQNNINSV